MDELENLRQEMSALKQNLDRQQIINKNMLRNVMKHRASWLNTLVNVEIIMLPLIFLLFVAFGAIFGISMWYAVIFLILAAVDTAFDWRTMRISPRLLGTASMIEIRRKLLRQKKERLWQTCISAPLAIIWLYFYFKAIMIANDVIDDVVLNFSISVGGVIGLAAAIVVIIVIYRKAQGTNDSILSDMNEADD